jgi:FAD/FMN-containing dehydrogenase
VTVDTSNITYNGKGAIINEAENTLRIPAGFTNGMVLHALHTLAPRNAALSVGNAGSVGYIGYTIVGGLGYATPMVGMSCDALVEIEMVLFDGRIVTANKTHNSELLWASCGSYGGLGIITEMTVKYRLLETEFFSYGRVHFSRQPTIPSQDKLRWYRKFLVTSLLLVMLSTVEGLSFIEPVCQVIGWGQRHDEGTRL